ncbi:MAG: hypothetical protein ACRDE2_05290 [Chitinophagaceae bacterium]
MHKQLHNIDQIFQKIVGPYEENPPDEDWERIKTTLDKRNSQKVKKKFYLFSAAAILVLLLMLGIGMYKIHKGNPNNRTGAGRYADQIKPTVILPEKMNPLNSPKAYSPSAKSKHLNYSAEIKLKHELKGRSPIPSYKFNALPIKRPLNNENYISLKMINLRPAYLTRKHTFPARISDKNNSFNVDSLKYLASTPISLENKNLRGLSDINRNNNIISPKQHIKYNDLFSRISLTIMFSPDISGYSLKNNNNANNQSSGDFRDKEQEGFSYTAGIMMDYAINKKWLLESGITLTNRMLSIYPSTVYAQKDYNGKVSYVLPTSTGISKIPDISNNNVQIGDSLELTSNSIQQLKYLSLPLILKYCLKKGRFTLQGYSGLEINLLSKSTTDVSFQTGNGNIHEAIDTIQGLKRSYLSGLAGIGVQYGLTNKIKISFTPTLSYSITPINQNTPFKKYPYSIGLWAGITYQF